MIRRLQLRNYKSFVDARFDAGPLTVIFGANDAGKSNLLDAIGLLSELAEVDNLHDAFDSPVHRGRVVEAFYSRLGFGQEGLSDLQKRGVASFEIVVDMDVQPAIRQRINDALALRERLARTRRSYTRVSEPVLRYRLEIRYETKRGELFVANESLLCLTRTGEPSKLRIPFMVKDRKNARFVVRVERQGQPRYLDVNRRRTVVSEISDPVYHPHIVAAKDEMRSWRSYYVEPSLVRREVGVHGTDDPGRHGEELAAFYWKLKQESPEILRGVCRNLAALVPSLEGIDVREVMGNLAPVVVERGGGEFPLRLASEGTLRLLCLLGIAAAPNPPAVAAYEEPETGVPPSRLDSLARILKNLSLNGNTQVILTTHSRTLLDQLREATFVACRRARDGSSTFLPYAEGDKTFAGDDLDERIPARETTA